MENRKLNARVNSEGKRSKMRQTRRSSRDNFYLDVPKYNQKRESEIYTDRSMYIRFSASQNGDKGSPLSNRSRSKGCG